MSTRCYLTLFFGHFHSVRSLICAISAFSSVFDSIKPGVSSPTKEVGGLESRLSRDARTVRKVVRTVRKHAKPQIARVFRTF